jgi:hypothetical protein
MAEVDSGMGAKMRNITPRGKGTERADSFIVLTRVGAMNESGRTSAERR